MNRREKASNILKGDVTENNHEQDAVSVRFYINTKVLDHLYSRASLNFVRVPVNRVIPSQEIFPKFLSD